MFPFPPSGGMRLYSVPTFPECTPENECIVRVGLRVPVCMYRCIHPCAERCMPALLFSVYLHSCPFVLYLCIVEHVFSLRKVSVSLGLPGCRQLSACSWQDLHMSESLLGKTQSPAGSGLRGCDVVAGEFPSESGLPQGGPQELISRCEG